MAEKFYSYSPYNYALNNPLRYIDPDGMQARSTHTDNSGNVLAVYNDGDLGVYKHDNTQNKADVDKNHSDKNTSGGGTKMGESLHMFSFVNHQAYNESNGTNLVAEGKIDFGSTWAHDQISGILNSHPTALGYANKARGGKEWDIKGHSPDGSTMFGSILGTGANGTNIYASARDAGNFAAGAVADDSYLPTSTLLNGFGAYNASGNSAVSAVFVFAGNIRGHYLDRSPTHGEDPLSYKAIESGTRNRINYFWNTMWNTKK